MKVHFFSFTLLLVLLPLAGHVSSAQSDAASIRKELQANMDRWGQALISAVQKKDDRLMASAAEEQFTPNCVMAWPGGPAYKDRKQVIEGFQAWLPEMKTLHRYQLRLQNLNMQGENTAVGVVTYDIAYDNVDPKTGKTHLINNKGRERDTWIRTSDGWKGQQVQGLQDLYYTDGKLDTPEIRDRREIQAQYDRWEAVAKSLDADKIQSFLEDVWTPGFVATHVGRSNTDRRQETEDTIKFVTMIKSVDRWAFTIEKLSRPDSKTVIVTVRANYAYESTDTEGRSHRITGIQTSKDTWVKSESGWKSSRSEEIQTREQRDGKPIRPVTDVAGHSVGTPCER